MNIIPCLKRIVLTTVMALTAMTVFAQFESVGLNYGLFNVYDGKNSHNLNINLGLGVRFY